MPKVFVCNGQKDIFLDYVGSQKEALALGLKFLKDMVAGMEDECRFLDIYQTDNLGEVRIVVSDFPMQVRIEGVTLTQPHIGPYDLLTKQKLFKLGKDAPDC